MPKARKRKVPVTSNEIIPSGSSNPRSSRLLIRRFHVLLKRQEQLRLSTSRSDAEALVDVQREIEEMGGLAAYQRMSDIGQGSDRGGGSEKVLISWLKDWRTTFDAGRDKLRLLEVGALRPDNYASCSSWIDVMPMDLHSRHPAIVEQDFLQFDQSEHKGKWDIISLSLVVNFVPEPRDRGRMLMMAHNMLKENGMLFLALPLPCVENSRYLTMERLQALMSTVGFAQLETQWKKGGKMGYWLYRRAEPDYTTRTNFSKKVVCRQGNRNNFVILLQ